MQGFSLKSNMEFVKKSLPIPFGFLRSGIKKISFINEALEVTLVEKIHGGTCDGFIIPGSIVRKKILPVIGLTGLLLKDYLNDNIGTYSDAIQSVVIESIMFNINHFIFYIPSNSVEAVDVLPMFNRDLSPMGEDFTDLQSNYEQYTPLPYITGLFAPKDDENALKFVPSDVNVTYYNCSDDKFEMDFSVDDPDNDDNWARCFTLKMPVSSSVPQSLTGYLCRPSFPFAITFTSNFVKGKYECVTHNERFDVLTNYRNQLSPDSEANWFDALNSTLDWDKCSGKVFEFLQCVQQYMVTRCEGRQCTFEELSTELKASWSECKTSDSLMKNVGKCLGYMVSWFRFGCRTCEHLPKDI